MLLTLLGLMLVLAGAAAGWAEQPAGRRRFSDQRYRVDRDADRGLGDPGHRCAGRGAGLAVRATATGDRAPSRSALFLGVARESDLAAWLRGIGHDQVRDVSVAPFSVSYLRQPGDLTSAPAPTGQRFWAAATSGAGGQVLSWQVSEGRWAIVVANADGTSGVDARVRVAARVPGLAGLAIGLVVAGVAALAVGALLIIHAARSRGRAGSPPSRTPGASPAAGVRGKGS